MNTHKRPEPVDSAFERVADGVHALAVWDASWQSYNTCYLVLRDRDVVLVDTGKAEHIAFLLRSLSRLGLGLEDVTAILATHGHHDHVGGSGVFPKASRIIHAKDWGLLSAEQQQTFTPGLPDEGAVLEFECVVLGQHTAGSVALFHPRSKVLFCGDHLCFFGAPLLPDGLVGTGAELRETCRAFVSRWGSEWPPRGEELERMNADVAVRRPEDRQRNNFDLFLKGVKKLARFDASALCTGHGPVLVGDIPSFLTHLIGAAGRRSR